MKRIAHVIGLVAAVLATACATANRPIVEGDVVIEHVAVVSPERQGPLEDVSVVISNGRIAAIGRDLRVSPRARIIQGRGRYLTPGLIDSHVHIGTPVGYDDVPMNARPDLLAAYRAQVPRAFLAFGFTTIVDVDLKPGNRAWFEATPLHPRLLHCSRAVRTAGGYGALRIRPETAARDYPNLVFEPGRAANWPATLDPADHTPERVVSRVADEGGSCVKAFVEPGFGVFDWPVPEPETLDALRTETRRRALTFMVHATGVQGWRAAVNARADVIAHGLWHWPGDRRSATPPEEAGALVRDVARAGTRVQPTLRVLDNDEAFFDAALLDDPRLALALPAAVVASLRTPEAEAARHAVAKSYDDMAGKMGITGGATPLIAIAEERARATLRLMLDAGVTLIFGSDTPSGEGIGNPPGLNGRLELQQWAEAGVSLRTILHAATLGNAEAFGLAAELGTVAAGKRADLLLLGANPLTSITAYDALEMLFVGGQPIPRNSLRSQD